MALGVSIVIPTWNGLELLKRFLPSVLAAALHYSETLHAPTELIIVDDASPDETVAWLVEQGFEEKAEGRAPHAADEWAQAEDENRRVDEEWQALQSQARAMNSGWPAAASPSAARRPEEETFDELPTTRLRFLRNETNRGFGETCNRGIAAAALPLIFLLNNDVEVAADAIAPLVENFADPSVFAAHCRVFELESRRECGTGKLGGFARGFIRVHRSYAAFRPRAKSPAMQTKTARPVPLYSMFASGGSAMFDREKFLALGGFDLLLAPFYWEDVELSYRAWKRGFTVLYEPRSVVRHRISSTIGGLDRRRVRLIEQRNRMVYHWIHLHDGGLLVSHLAWVLLLALTAPLRFQPRFFLSFIAALQLLPQIRQRRRDEKRLARQSDRDLFKRFATFAARDDVLTYKNDAELERINTQQGER